MSELSPAAQAVLDAVEDDCIHPDDKHRIAAAALRAVADQVVPEEPLYYGNLCWEFKRDERQDCRQQLLAIANELEASSQTHL